MANYLNSIFFFFTLKCNVTNVCIPVWCCLVCRSDDANKAFSAAVQMHDTLVKAWALWGDYLEALFTRER